jgi:BlaI family transcriptional regulator, penicillinase repressor
MKSVPRISESEWRVMKVLWEHSPLGAGEVVEALTSETDWKPKTVKTLLNRLVGKKAVGYEQEGRAYQYFPLVAERDCVREESRSFLRRVYGGAFMPMLAAMLEDQKLSAAQIDDLKQILARKEGIQ